MSIVPRASYGSLLKGDPLGKKPSDAKPAAKDKRARPAKMAKQK